LNFGAAAPVADRSGESKLAAGSTASALSAGAASDNTSPHAPRMGEKAMNDAHPTLTLYFHPLASYCWKVLLALYETGTPFEQALVEGLPKSDAKFSALWPIAKMPLLYDVARKQATPETSIIIEYLQLHYPGSARLLPDDHSRLLEVRLWDRFFDLYVHTPMQKLVADRLRADADKDPAGVRDARATLDTAYRMLEERAGSQTWAVGGSFTMADCSAMPALFYAEAVHPFSVSYPTLSVYFNRLMDRPASRRVVEEARPYFQFFPFFEALHPRFTGVGNR
jgi:glutathione S-transferase